MSISVKNAKAIANRAGAKARGFSPITDFINDMSMETMRIVSKINQESVALSQVAIKELRAREAFCHFDNALKIAESSEFRSSMLENMKQLNDEKDERHSELLRYAKLLGDLMDEIMKLMAVANVIVSNSRIEAVSADEYRANLEGIATDIENACNIIRQRVQESNTRLQNAIDQWRRVA